MDELLAEIEKAQSWLPALAMEAVIRESEGLEMSDRLAMLIDSSKCIACRACQVACKQWNDLQGWSYSQTVNEGTYENPLDLSAQTWTRVKFIEYDGAGRLQWLFLKEGCFHCTEAACVDVCPTQALKYHPLGLITLEREVCNGCGYCTQACPFSIPRLDKSGFTWQWKATKCVFCQDRTASGLRPACVNTCPTGALSWGSRDEMIGKGKDRVALLKAERGFPNGNLYGEMELGGLGRLYVLTESPLIYGLPEEPRYPTSVMLWQKVIQPVGAFAVIATAVTAFFAFLISRSNIRMEEVE